MAKIVIRNTSIDISRDSTDKEFFSMVDFSLSGLTTSLLVKNYGLSTVGVLYNVDLSSQVPRCIILNEFTDSIVGNSGFNPILIIWQYDNTTATYLQINNQFIQKATGLNFSFKTQSFSGVKQLNQRIKINNNLISGVYHDFYGASVFEGTSYETDVAPMQNIEIDLDVPEIYFSESKNEDTVIHIPMTNPIGNVVTPTSSSKSISTTAMLEIGKQISPEITVNYKNTQVPVVTDT